VLFQKLGIADDNDLDKLKKRFKIKNEPTAVEFFGTTQ
jgi:hypothetical protein